MAAANCLVQITPYDPAEEALVPLYFALRDHETDAADTPASKLYQGRVKGFELARAAVRPDGALSGRSAPGSGALTLGISQSWKDDGTLAALKSYAWGGRAWEIRRVTAPGAAWSTAERIGGGTVSTFEQISKTEIQIAFHDRSVDFAAEMQAAHFEGTGGVEGGEDLKNKPRPLVFGYEHNAPGILVDTVNRIVEFHAGPVEEIVEVRDNGNALVKAASAPPAAGEWFPDLSAGRVTLGADPVGEITGSVKGAKPSGVWLQKAGEIVSYLVQEFGGLSAGEVDAVSIAALDAARTGTVSIATGTVPVNLSVVLDRLLSPLGWWGFTRTDQFRVGVIAAPVSTAKTDAAIVKVITDYKIVKGSLRVRPLGIPPRRIDLEYGRLAALQSADQLAGGLSMENRLLWSTEYRLATAPDAAGQAARAQLHPRSKPQQVPSALAWGQTSAAEAVAGGVDALVGVPRGLAVLETDRVTALDRGDEVWIEHPDYLLGLAGLVLGVTDRGRATGFVEILV